MKKVITFFSVFILCLCTFFSTSAFADYIEANNSTPFPGNIVEPCAEQTEWVYRIYNGNYEKRLWSHTYGKWLTDWIVLGPAT